MRRRDFITLLGVAAVAWPLVARAQQPAMPVIGFLGSGTPQAYEDAVRAVRQGLGEMGYVEGRNVAFEYRWAQDQTDQLPMLAIVDRRVAVIVALGLAAALPAKAVTSTIPVVFRVGGDPVQLGLVASMNRPGGNITGVIVASRELISKKLEFLRELVPNVAVIAMLQANTPDAEANINDFQTMARTIGQRVLIVRATNEREVDRAFAKLVQERVGALMVQADQALASRRDQIVALAARHAIPAIYSDREFVTAGGLMNYGSSLIQVTRVVGLYAGRILKGNKPSDLPVMFPAKFEFVLNLKTAKALGLDIPLKLHAFADEVIE